jgi:hypothetical protein
MARKKRGMVDAAGGADGTSDASAVGASTAAAVGVARGSSSHIAAASGLALGTGDASATSKSKRSRRGNKWAVNEVIRRLHKIWPGGLPGGMSVAGVRRKVSDKDPDGFRPSPDTVKRALIVLGYVLPKQ